MTQQPINLTDEVLDSIHKELVMAVVDHPTLVGQIHSTMAAIRALRDRARAVVDESLPNSCLDCSHSDPWVTSGRAVRALREVLP